MKVFERPIVGYSADCLAGFFRSTLFPSPFFDQAAPVRGICFASGENAIEEAHALAKHNLNLGTILIRTGDVTPDGWRDLLQTLSPPKLTLSRVALIVPDADRVAPAGQEKIADAVLATPPGAPGLIIVSDHRNLDARSGWTGSACCTLQINGHFQAGRAGVFEPAHSALPEIGWPA